MEKPEQGGKRQMDRPIFKGSIDLGCGFLIPMKVSKAHGEHDVRFHEYHAADFGRVGRSKPCKVCGNVLETGDIVKGVEISKDSIITFTSSELENLPLKSTKVIEVDRFVGADELNPLIFEEAYYISPDEIGVKAFELFVRGLKKQRKVAIGKIAMRQREHICAISPMGNGLLLNTIYYADEIRGMPQAQKAEVLDDEIELICQVINKFTKPFEHEIYRDEYNDAVQALIDAKLKGEALPTASASQPASAESLRDALTNLLNE